MNHELRTINYQSLRLIPGGYHENSNKNPVRYYICSWGLIYVFTGKLGMPWLVEASMGSDKRRFRWYCDFDWFDLFRHSERITSGPGSGG